MNNQPECKDTGNAIASQRVDQEELNMQRLLRWLEEQGATFSATVRIDARARRLHTTRALVQGELLMHIPAGLMITERVAKESEIGKLLAQHGCKFGAYETIAAFLLHAKREGGFWKPYLDVLPQEFSEHPLLFSESEIEYLKGSRLFRSILERKAENEAYYDQLPPSVKEAYTLDEFTWARCILITRAFRVMFNGTPGMALVPLADMFDHAAPSKARYIPQSENGFTVTAAGPLEAGTALFTLYGNRGNGDLLYTYGFCIEDNPFNDVEILLPSLPDGHSFTEHANKLGTAVAGMRSFKVRRSCIDDAASAMFSYLRLAHLGGSPGIGATEIDKAGKAPPFSRENEAAALTALEQACARHLREYPTSIAEDDALLVDPALPRNVRNMIKVRRDEKSILNYFLELTNIALPVLRDESRDLSEHAGAGSPYVGYFAEIGPRFASKTGCAAL